MINALAVARLRCACYFPSLGPEKGVRHGRPAYRKTRDRHGRDYTRRLWVLFDSCSRQMDSWWDG
jgi:hypothetical protein